MKTNKKNIIFLKKLVGLAIKAVLGVFTLVLFFGAFYWYNNRLFLWEASLLWPQEEFSESKFKVAPPEERLKMVVDLVRNQKILGMDSAKITDLLGPETGDYYHTDSNFTYRLSNKGDADWMLTLVSGENKKIERVFIRKSCCSTSQKILYRSLEISEPFFKWVVQ